MTKGKKAVALVHLTREEKKRLAKPREGFLPFAEPFIDLYEANEAELRLKKKTPAQARSDVAEYRALREEEREIEEHLQLVRDTRMLIGAEVYTTHLHLYARATAAARTDIEMARKIWDYTKFMKQCRKRKPKP